MIRPILEYADIIYNTSLQLHNKLETIIRRGDIICNGPTDTQNTMYFYDLHHNRFCIYIF